MPDGTQGDLFATALPSAPGRVAAPEPPAKWVGSKRWLVAKHAHLLPNPATTPRLVLPFCGAGSVGYHYAAAGCAVAFSDANPHLINLHTVLRNDVDRLIVRLAEIEAAGYGRAQFLDIRCCLNEEPGAPPVDRAAWFIAINRWGFNGLWRVNGKGRCNVPFGKPSTAGTVPRLCDADNLRACSRALTRCTFAVADFEDHVVVGALAGPPGTAVYFDPPYVAASTTADFTGYTADGFGPRDQDRLAALLPRLDAAGVRWALSNSDTPDARARYTRPGWTITRLERSGSVSSKADGRGAVGEILVRNYGDGGLL